jgi:anti-anti-sigma factor
MPRTGSGAALLTVAVSARLGFTLVSLAGEGDATVREQLRAAVMASVAGRTPHLIVDLSRLSFIDCSCVRVLWRASRMAEESGGTLVLAAPQPLVRRVMELWGAGRLLRIHDSVAKAAVAARRMSPAS